PPPLATRPCRSCGAARRCSRTRSTSRGPALRVVADVVWQKLTMHGKPWGDMGRMVGASYEAALACLLRGGASGADRVQQIRPPFAGSAPVEPAGRYIHCVKRETFCP